MTNDATRDRELLLTLEAEFGKGKVTRSFLREEAVLVNQNQTYAFAFDGNVKPKISERKVASQDIFVANRLGLFLLREDAVKIGSGVLRTAVTAEFAAAAGFVPADLEAIWNGSIKAEIDNVTIFEALESQDFRKVVTEFQPQYGKVSIEPRLVLNGKAKNKLTVTVPTWNGIQLQSVVAGTDHKLVLCAFGFLITGAAK